MSLMGIVLSSPLRNRIQEILDAFDSTIRVAKEQLSNRGLPLDELYRSSGASKLGLNMKVLIQNSVRQFLCVDDTWSPQMSEARAFAISLEAMIEAIFLRSSQPAMKLQVLSSCRFVAG